MKMGLKSLSRLTRSACTIARVIGNCFRGWSKPDQYSGRGGICAPGKPPFGPGGFGNSVSFCALDVCPCAGWGGEPRPGAASSPRLHRAQRRLWREPAGAPRCFLDQSAPTLTLVPGWDCETSPDPLGSSWVPVGLLGWRGLPWPGHGVFTAATRLRVGAESSDVWPSPSRGLRAAPAPCRPSAAVARCHVGARPQPARSCGRSASGRQKARNQ